MEQRITVAVRIRPALEEERFYPLCAHKADDGRSIIVRNEDEFTEPAVFQFDEVYDETDDQRSIYEESVRDLVDHALQGANSTVLTYGQTGSGKTYTILGSLAKTGVTEESGVFLRVFSDLFFYRNSVEESLHIMIYISAVELYMDDVMDLFKQRKAIKLRETPEETVMQGLNTVEVKSMDDVIQCFNIANTYRSVASTKMNDCSSRSHALFSIDIYQVPIACCLRRPSKEQLMDSNGIPFKGIVDNLVRSRISLVDLAGSERVKRSGVEGKALLEAQFINKSLSSLGTSINAMYIENKHIPFRESKLTKLLKNSFVDRTSRLLLIGQVAPPSSSAQESQGTLRFCDRVKGLKVGKAVGFVSAEEEEQYTRTLRLHEELTAELRVAKVQCYYKPQQVAVLANRKGLTSAVARQIVIEKLKSNAESIRVAKEEEEMQRRKAEIQKEYDDRVRIFVETMNAMIEEYEKTVSEVKKEKKAAKRFSENESTEQNELLSNAKKAKKHRVRMEDRIADVNAALKESAVQLTELEVGIGKSEDKEETRTDPEGNETAIVEDKGVHTLVGCFYTHATELGRLHDLYVQRLGATQRQRSNVRRAKLFSSDIITHSSLVSDIIDFIIGRAVDIVNGAISPRQRYTWLNIDGLSTTLRSSEQWYPPLITQLSEEEKRISNVPVAFHHITFLSEDDSDNENSHYPHETRRRYVKESVVDNGDGYDVSFPQGGASAACTSGKLTENEKRTKNKVSDLKGLQPQSNSEGVQLNHYQQKDMHKTSRDTGGNNALPEDKEDLKDKNNAEQAPSGTDSLQGTDEQANQEMRSPHPNSKEHKKYLMRVYDSPSLVPELLRFMRGGTVMIKHGRHGKPHRRLFWITSVQNVRQLMWMDPGVQNANQSSINLDDVSYIQIGCFSSVFRRNPVSPTDPSFHRCFSLGVRDGRRTVDMVAASLPDLEAWILGLSHLVRVDPVWGGKLDITKEAQFDLLNCFEANLCEANYIYPTQYIKLKKCVQQVAARTLAALKECGNDPRKAQEKLDGIHLPAINDKGAVLLTKGELRSLANEELDILRITKIWVLFQQMNLLFDDNFTPATTFGVTHRR